MSIEELKARTKRFAINVIKLVETFPHAGTGQVIGKQLLRAATSVGANYRASCRARSQTEFIAKIRIVEEEADECMYWLELVQEAGLGHGPQIETLHGEANELTAICVASSKTARSHLP